MLFLLSSWDSHHSKWIFFSLCRSYCKCVYCSDRQVLYATVTNDFPHCMQSRVCSLPYWMTSLAYDIVYRSRNIICLRHYVLWFMTAEKSKNKNGCRKGKINRLLETLPEKAWACIQNRRARQKLLLIFPANIFSVDKSAHVLLRSKRGRIPVRIELV